MIEPKEGEAMGPHDFVAMSVSRTALVIGIEVGVLLGLNP
jgi:hypothetical protein